MNQTAMQTSESRPQTLRGARISEPADALVARATTLAQDGRREEAIRLFRQAIEACPEHPRAHHNLGVAFAEEKRFVEALECFQEALRVQPGYAEAHYSIGNTLGELGRTDDAITAYRNAIRYKPDYVDALHNLGVALTIRRRSGEAAVFLRQAVRLRPDFAEAHNSLGLAQMEQGDFAGAESTFEQVLRLDPRRVNALTNLGSTFKERGRLEEAIACYDLALALEPDSASTHWNRSLALLQAGEYEQGWAEYEWRWDRKANPPRSLPSPRWDGSSFEGKTMLLQVEQGLGDMIQFLRYAPLVKSQGGTVVVSAPPALVSLFSTCAGVDYVVSEGDELPPIDVHIPLMSLPFLFKTALDTIPCTVPYLAPDPDRVETWNKRLSGLSGLKVGIVWKGNPLHLYDRHRSFSLTLLEPLAKVDEVTFISLQKASDTSQLPCLRNRQILNVGTELADFADTAAVISQLDLVISCDTSVAHLAGALGAPVWVAISTIADWRWLRGREDSPWYPTMRLFRQEKQGEWKPVFKRMAMELRRLVKPRLAKDCPV